MVPCYNCATTIRRAVLSILEQTRQPTQIILVDDASTDETPEVINQLFLENPHIISAVYSKTNNGPSATRNIGWKLANKEFIAFLDADDTWHPKKIEVQHTFMSENENIYICGHLTGKKDELQNNHHQATYINVSKIPLWRLLWSNPFSTPSVMIRRTIAERFSPALRYCEDFQLWLSIAAKYGYVFRIEMMLAWYHKKPYGESGLSKNLWCMEKGEIIAICSTLRSHQLLLPLVGSAILYSLMKYLWRTLKVHQN